ncbi:hypothetical protein SLS55_008776 [Diplodia seriata]|uniref:Uncharacterized protein n=1 Tax=Diplodia seriata TaxID=420778 RepID=A0ABR3C6X8_9PEZI
MGSKRPTYPRGAKGLKKFGDPDIPSTRWTPNGIKLQPFDYQMLRLRGCFFPAPSKLRHVETLSYEAELENGLEHHDASSNALQKTSPGRSSSSSLPAAWNELEDVSQSHQHLFGPNADHQNITSQLIAGEEPMDYYGPARDYAGSVSSGSDSWSDSDTDGTHNMDIESGFAGSLGAFATETKACDSDTDIDSMSIDLPDSDSEAHDPEGFGIIQGQNVPQVTLRPASIAQMADIMYAIDDELDHDEVRSSRHLSLLPPLPEDYRYLVTPTMAFCRKPYLVVPATSRRFDI